MATSDDTPQMAQLRWQHQMTHLRWHTSDGTTQKAHLRWQPQMTHLRWHTSDSTTQMAHLRWQPQMAQLTWHTSDGTPQNSTFLHNLTCRPTIHPTITASPLIISLTTILIFIVMCRSFTNTDILYWSASALTFCLCLCLFQSGATALSGPWPPHSLGF